jgi:hypothetical protein
MVAVESPVLVFESPQKSLVLIRETTQHENLMIYPENIKKRSIWDGLIPGCFSSTQRPVKIGFKERAKEIPRGANHPFPRWQKK